MPELRVVAAGALISEPAMKAGVIVKFSQNVLLGVAAFGLSIWWTMRQRVAGGQRPSVRLIWERFPKFVLGFLAASLVCSFALNPALPVNYQGQAVTLARLDGSVARIERNGKRIARAISFIRGQAIHIGARLPEGFPEDTLAGFAIRIVLDRPDIMEFRPDEEDTVVTIKYYQCTHWVGNTCTDSVPLDPPLVDTNIINLGVDFSQSIVKNCDADQGLY